MSYKQLGKIVFTEAEQDILADLDAEFQDAMYRKFPEPVKQGPTPRGRRPKN